MFVPAGMLGVASPHGSRVALHHFSVDCSHAHRGLFAGILVIVLTIISLIMFFVLASNPDTIIVRANCNFYWLRLLFNVYNRLFLQT